MNNLFKKLRHRFITLLTELEQGNSSHQRSSREQGFTLIELLTVIGILGILVTLSLNSYSIFKASAGYGVAQLTLRQGITAMEASLSVPDADYSAVNTSQTTQGPLANGAANTFLPQFQVPKNTKVFVFYDPACLDGSCPSQRLIVKHCLGKKYTYWTRWGDGAEALVEDVPGEGCA